MVRARNLPDLYEKYKKDPSFNHLRAPHINFVPGVGAGEPAVMIVGEAPGATENLQEVPFCGPSGRLLVQWMGLAGLGEENSFITNVLKYRPPGNMTPSAEEIVASRPYLQEEFRLLGKPRVIISVGATAFTTLIAGKEDRPKGSVSNLAGKLIELNNRTDLAVMFHPSFALRQAESSPIHKRIEGCWIKLGRVLRGRGLL